MTVKLSPIERLSDVSPADFEQIVLCDRPVILAGAARDWLATGRWTVPYLVEKLRGLRVRVRTSATHVHPDFARMQADWSRPGVLRLLDHLGIRLGRRADPDEQRSFGEFLELLSGPEGFRHFAGAEELGLFRDGAWAPPLAPLREDYEIPRWVPEGRLHSAALWISARGTRSHLHYDGDRLHNLNAQITGSKHVQLYAPDHMRSLYPYLFTQGRPSTFSQVNVEAVDERRFPLFSGVEGCEGTLERGDLLFIPAYWYHTFKHLGELNVNVNFWWRAEFVRLTPVSARDYLGAVTSEALANSRVPPVWLLGWLRKLERRIVESTAAARH
jgi:lysine-specific demethylase 8